jgi:hypothetical protein
VLTDLEWRCSGRSIATLFDLIVGTSTAGILALGLTVPNDDGTQPRNSAASLRETLHQASGKDLPRRGEAELNAAHLRNTKSDGMAQEPWPELLIGRAHKIGAPFGGNPRFAGGLDTSRAAPRKFLALSWLMNHLVQRYARSSHQLRHGVRGAGAFLEPSIPRDNY